MPSIQLGARSPRVKSTAFIAEGVILVGDVEIGDEVSIWFNSVVRADINTITIGNRSNIQDCSVLHVTHEHPVNIGADVTIGHRAIIHGASIGNNCLIGMGSVVLDNARVEPFSLVAAGAVVKEGFVVPEGMLAAGVPARIVRSLSEEEREQIQQSALHYVQYASAYRTQAR